MGQVQRFFCIIESKFLILRLSVNDTLCRVRFHALCVPGNVDRIDHQKNSENKNAVSHTGKHRDLRNILSNTDIEGIQDSGCKSGCGAHSDHCGTCHFVKSQRCRKGNSDRHKDHDLSRHSHRCSKNRK